MIGRLLSALPATALSLLALACSGPEHGVPCPKPTPILRLQLTAADGVLPDDARLCALYQGNQYGTYPPLPGAAPNDNVCCRFGAPTDGALPHVPCDVAPAADAGPAMAIQCDLWTVAATEIVVTAAGYEPIDVIYQPPNATDGCPAPPVDRRLVLTHGDGGGVLTPVPCPPPRE